MSKKGVSPIIKPIGLVTSPNRVSGMPPGAMYDARGVYIRDPLVLSSQPAEVPLFDVYSSADFPVVGYSIEQAGITGGAFIYWVCSFADNIWRWTYATTGTSSAVIYHIFNESPASNPERLWINSAGGIQLRWFAGVAKNGERLVVPTGYSTSVVDSGASGTSIHRVAGISQPKCQQSTFPASSAAGALNGLSRALYIGVFRRKYSDGVELVSAPSCAKEVFNLDTARRPVTLIWLFTGTVLAGDYLDIYRTKQQVADYNAPGTYVELGSEFLLAASHQITSADLASGQFSMVDSTIDDNLGEALYTNTGVRGAAAANAMPPPCKAVETFKGYTFYGNVTELPSYSFRVQSYWGSMSGATPGPATSSAIRTAGIGAREIRGLPEATSPFNTFVVDAADFFGLAVGQELVVSTGLPINTSGRITAINVGTRRITIAGSFGGVGAPVTAYTIDVVEIDGVRVPADSFTNFSGLCLVGTAGSGSPSSLRDYVGAACFGSAKQVQQGVNYAPVLPSDGVTIFHQYQINQFSARGPLTIRATNGLNYVPQLPEFTSTPLSVPPVQRTNMIRWSEENNCEAAPVANSAFVGHGEIYAMKATRDALYVFASDGLWRLSGSGGSAGAGFDWRVDPVDTTLSLTNSTCVASLNDCIYALTNRGLMKIDSSGTVTPLTLDRIDDLLSSIPWDPTSTAWVTADETHNEIVFCPVRPVDAIDNQNRVYTYNVDTDTITEVFFADLSGVFTNPPRHAFSSKTYGGLVFLRASKTTWLGGTTAAGSVCCFQPLVAGDPFTILQFRSADMLFDAGDDGGQVYMFTNPNDRPVTADSYTWFSSALTIKKHEAGLARASSGISRNAPAVGSSIMLGWVNSEGQSIKRFHGMGVHLVQSTNRRILR